MPEYHFTDPIDKVLSNVDRSLVSMYPYLVAVNMTSYNDWKISIYLASERQVYYTNAATGNYTKTDLLYLPSGEYPLRYDYLGNTNAGSGLKTLSAKSYYNFV